MHVTTLFSPHSLPPPAPFSPVLPDFLIVGGVAKKRYQFANNARKTTPMYLQYLPKVPSRTSIEQYHLATLLSPSFTSQYSTTQQPHPSTVHPLKRERNYLPPPEKEEGSCKKKRSSPLKARALSPCWNRRKKFLSPLSSLLPFFFPVFLQFCFECGGGRTRGQGRRFLQSV